MKSLNGVERKVSLESTRESLLNPFDFFEQAMLRVQYRREYPACSHLNHCDCFSHYCASLAEEEESEEESEEVYDYAPPPSVSTCRYGTPPKLSSNTNSLVADENTRDVMVWLIKAYNYNHSRVLNV